MKKIICLLFMLALISQSNAQLRFDSSKGTLGSLEMPNGEKVSFTAYEKLYYVTNVEDSTYQYLNVYIPQGATHQSPIFLRTYVGGYMSSPASSPRASDATGRALKEGFVVVIPGTRGRNATIVADKAYQKAHKGVTRGETIYTGKAPAAILDLKAAIRYLRFFDKEMLGDAEHIITDGTSAGGAMSSLMGATGNNPAYESLLKAMGAADTKDNVFAAVCYCPIIDLENADMAYEWLFNGTDSRQKGNANILAISNELKALFPAYLNSLKLKTPEGKPLTDTNYLDYIKSELIRSAQIAKNAGATIPDSLGFVFNQESGFGAPPINGIKPDGAKIKVMNIPNSRMPQAPRGGGRQGEYIIDLDMQKYLNYVVSTQPLKTAPAFDTQGVEGQRASGENDEFGNQKEKEVNYTAFSAGKTGAILSAELLKNVYLMNPMNFIEDPQTDVAPHWYIRHGARDRDTAFPVPVNLALKLQNTGKDVNFLLAWNRPHSGDYALDELFEWIKKILQ